MAAETSIQFFCSDNFNAPSLDNNWGALINVLDACLVNGLSLPALSSASGDGSQVTLTFTVDHKVKMFQVIRLTGFSPDNLNGDYRVIGVPNTSKLVIESTVTSITNGTVSLKPLGYEKSFSGTNKAVYRNANQNAMYRPFLRVDNSLDPVYSSTYAKFAKVGVLETCTGINDISGAQIPFDSTNQTKNWVGTGSGKSAYVGWAKWYYARNTDAYNASADSAAPASGARPWMIVGNGQAFYLLNSMTPTDTYKVLSGFGVYDLVDGVSATPYFLLAIRDYATVSTSRDFSLISNGATFYKAQNPALIFNGVGVATQQDATPGHGLYASGKANTYANDFACLPCMLLSNSYLMGTLPFLRYIAKSRSDAAFTSVAYSGRMYVIDYLMQESGAGNGMIAFDLGGL